MKKFRKIYRITHQQLISYHTIGSENQCNVLFGISLREYIEQRGEGLYWRQSLGRTYRLRRQSLRRVSSAQAVRLSLNEANSIKTRE